MTDSSSRVHLLECRVPRELLREEWCKLAGQPQTEAELEATGRGVARGRPFRGEQWVRRTAKQRGPESTLRAPNPTRNGQPNQ